MRVGTVDVDFGHHREANAVVDQAPFGNGLFRAGFLVGKLVARETQDYQSAVFELSVEGFQPFVLRREAAFAGGVDHQNHLALELVEGKGLALEGLRGKRVKGSVGHV